MWFAFGATVYDGERYSRGHFSDSRSSADGILSCLYLDMFMQRRSDILTLRYHLQNDSHV
jgi:hypothetical protein